MRTFGAVLAVLLWPGRAPAQGSGTVVGNGGDLVTCQPGGRFPAGTYVLDYVVTYDYETNNADVELLSPIKIVEALRSRLPAMEKSLWKFLWNRYQDNPESPFQWRKASLGLLDLNDERLLEKLPENCTTERNGERVLALTQAVIREPRELVTIFHYDEEALRRIEHDILQSSFLWVHEWLWELVPDARVNRDVNRYLHSRAFLESSAEEAHAVMRKLGAKVLLHPPAQLEPAQLVPHDTSYLWQSVCLNASRNFSGQTAFWERARRVQELGVESAWAPSLLYVHEADLDARGYRQDPWMAVQDFPAGRDRVRFLGESSFELRHTFPQGEFVIATCELGERGEVRCGPLGAPDVGFRPSHRLDLDDSPFPYFLEGRLTDDCLTLSARQEFARTPSRWGWVAREYVWVSRVGFPINAPRN